MDDSLTRKVQQQFGDHAANYVGSTVHSSGYSLDRLLELIDLQPAAQPRQRVLDIATGGGHVALGMAKRGTNTLVSDLTPRMLDAARTYIDDQLRDQPAAGAAAYAQMNAMALPFADNTLDRVTCRIAAHHFPDPERFVREAARVVKPGGIVGVVDQIGPDDRPSAEYVNAFEQLRDPSHVWEHDRATWESFFDLAGLTITHVEIARNRLEFGWWVRMQNCAPVTITRLEVMLRQMPEGAAKWLQPELVPPGEPGAMYFSLWQLILIGVKR